MVSAANSWNIWYLSAQLIHYARHLVQKFANANFITLLPIINQWGHYGDISHTFGKKLCGLGNDNQRLKHRSPSLSSLTLNIQGHLCLPFWFLQTSSLPYFSSIDFTYKMNSWKEQKIVRAIPLGSHIIIICQVLWNIWGLMGKLTY